MWAEASDENEEAGETEAHGEVEFVLSTPDPDHLQSVFPITR